MLLVVSGTYREAYEYASRRRLAVGQWQYVAGVFTVRGSGAGDYVLVGTWRHRTDVCELLHELQRSGRRLVDGCDSGAAGDSAAG